MLICIACRIAAIMLFLIYQDKGVERIMFLWNLKTLRKQKGFSQEELATRLHVVRQTISKWEKNLSVPDADTLIRLAEILEVSVSAGYENWKWKCRQWCCRTTIQNKRATGNQEPPLTSYLENCCHYISSNRSCEYFYCCLFQRSRPQQQYPE